MVVWTLVGIVVSRIPYADKIRALAPENSKVAPNAESDAPHTTHTTHIVLPPSPRQRIHMRLMDRRLATPSPSIDEDETVRETDSVDTKHGVMQQYLDEQNAKFDSLINRNLSKVLQQQHSYEEERGWRDHVVALAAARLLRGVATNLAGLVHHASKAVSLYAFQRKEAVVPADNTPSDNAVHTAAVVAAVEAMEYRDKVLLLRRLHEELGVEDARVAPEDALLMDRVQEMTLLLIRLAFIAVRLIGPVTSALYTRFKNNDLLFINSRNLNRLLGSVISVMESVEETLDAKPDDILDQIAFDPQIGGDTWAASVARYTLKRSITHDFAADLRYAHYFTRPVVESDEDEDYTDAVEKPSVLQVAEEFASQMA